MPKPSASPRPKQALPLPVRPMMWDGKVERAIWRPSDGNGDPNVELFEKSQYLGRGHPTWKLFAGNVPKSITLGENEPPRYVYLDDKAAYAIFSSSAYTNREKQLYWGMDFNNSGRMKRGRPNRGRPAYKDDDLTTFASVTQPGKYPDYIFTGETAESRAPASRKQKTKAEATADMIKQYVEKQKALGLPVELPPGFGNTPESESHRSSSNSNDVTLLDNAMDDFGPSILQMRPATLNDSANPFSQSLKRPQQHSTNTGTYSNPLNNTPKRQKFNGTVKSIHNRIKALMTALDSDYKELNDAEDDMEKFNEDTRLRRNESAGKPKAQGSIIHRANDYRIQVWERQAELMTRISEKGKMIRSLEQFQDIINAEMIGKDDRETTWFLSNFDFANYRRSRSEDPAEQALHEPTEAAL
ncbi:hypothetical protein AOQ84DRAFT_385149 [Glonium stellatum]|uniref:Uncharacterized protein n=1 Tax=Glonium stellatum TaxID=574774 RepID=A0A8E2JY50_9PEZI|nr:hypothetical protein AOQ84DRAFT_385149 [Glonium stellatum]